MPTYTLKSNAINSAAQIFFVGDNGLTNLVGGGSVTATGTMSTSTVATRVIYGDAAGAGNFLSAVCAAAITANQKLAVLTVGHFGLSVNTDRIIVDSTAGIWVRHEYTGSGPRVGGYFSSWGWSAAAAPVFSGYTHPDTGKLRVTIMGRETGGTQRHYADNVGGNALTGNGVVQGHTAAANTTWEFGGSPDTSAPGGFGVGIFAVFIGIGPTELADYIAANGTGSTEADKVYSALLDAGASGVTGDSSITLGAITGTASGTVSTAGSVTGSSAITLGALGSSAAGTVTAFATFTSEPLKTNNGTLQASLALDWVRLYNVTTGALVVTKTGISTNGAGVFTVTDAALTVGQTYKADWKITTTGETRMPSKAAT